MGLRRRGSLSLRDRICFCVHFHFIMVHLIDIQDYKQFMTLSGI